jgi:hypothetical protein
VISRHASNFESAAREHLRSLETTGGTPDQIATELSAVATSYARDGLTEEAELLRELLRQDRQRWIADLPARGTPSSETLGQVAFAT